MADDRDIPIIYANDIIKNYYTTTEFDKEIAKYFPLIPIGGKIFYDAGDNGATYIFYDSNGDIISGTSISELQNAVYYKKLGNSNKDRFYAVHPNMLNNGKIVYWGFYCNADVKPSGGNIVSTGTGIGTGKTATRAILDYISIYASNEVASDNKPSSDISQSSPNGYNLYKNCGTSYNYLWDNIKNANRYSLGGHNDWFIPSKDELKQIVTSGVISSITGNNYIWSGSADYIKTANTLYSAWGWDYYNEKISIYGRNGFLKCLICRAF